MNLVAIIICAVFLFSPILFCFFIFLSRRKAKKFEEKLADTRKTAELLKHHEVYRTSMAFLNEMGLTSEEVWDAYTRSDDAESFIAILRRLALEKESDTKYN